MIQLGCCDAGVDDAVQSLYLKQVEQLTRVPMSSVADGADKLRLTTYTLRNDRQMSVKQVQQALSRIGFFPGGEPDGICGYRTLSAIRLFQEYVRTIEGQACTPDGLFGPNSQRHLERWLQQGQTAAWLKTIEAWQAGEAGSSEYFQWLEMLARYRQQVTAKPSRMQAMVNAFSGDSDTIKTPAWDYSSRHIHLIGIRRDEFSGKFDDVFVLLIKGMVFKFQGSTEPGASSHPKGPPYLVNGQHDYQFGWHRRAYLALRPLRLNRGVLVFRSAADQGFSEQDLDDGLEANATINIHWGGKGGSFDVRSWSEGCQVINGLYYTNHLNELVDCSAFVARNNTAVNKNRSTTRGAYNVLLDLVTTLSGDTGNNVVKYTLLNQADLSFDKHLEQTIAQSHNEVLARLA